MAIEKVNEEIDLEIAPDSAQEISTPMMEGDAMMLDDGSAIVNPVEDTSLQGAFNANLAELIPDDELESLAKRQSRFKLMTGLTKEEYYTELATCKIQFNSALQDYVSWTVIESTAFGADIVFPNFRSFPEFIDTDRMYKPFDVKDALETIENVLESPKVHPNIVDISDLGRQMEGYIIANDYEYEICVWHEKELCESLLEQEDKKLTYKKKQLAMFEETYGEE